MHLFAAGPLSFTTEQLVASAVVGLGAGFTYGGFKLVQKARRLRAAQNQPTTDVDDESDGGEKPDAKEPAKPMSLPAAVVLFALGVALLVGGIVWRIAAEE